MTGDKIIIEQTATGYRSTAIPGELAEFAMLNSITAQHRADEDRARQDKIAADRAYWERNRRLAGVTFGFIFGAGVLLGLAHLGAIAGWVAHVATVAGGIWLGHEFTK